MTSAKDWSTEAMYCHQIHCTDAQRAKSLKGLIKRIQLDAWKQGMIDAADIVMEAGFQSLGSHIDFDAEQRKEI